MSLGLTVVTHTTNRRRSDINRCTESIKNALPINAKHVIIECNECFDTFLFCRYNALKLDDVVIFVDDDDYISKDSLRLCMDALNANDVGIAFTYEIKVMTNGNHWRNTPPINHSEICNHPETIHHMVAYRTKYISERSLNLALKYGVGIEWTMSVCAALSAGAIFVPVDGYYWVQHNAQFHKDPNIQEKFKNSLLQMSEEMKSWIKIDSAIPHWKG